MVFSDITQITCHGMWIVVDDFILWQICVVTVLLRKTGSMAWNFDHFDLRDLDQKIDDTPWWHSEQVVLTHHSSLANPHWQIIYESKRAMASVANWSWRNQTCGPLIFIVFRREFPPGFPCRYFFLHAATIIVSRWCSSLRTRVLQNFDLCSRFIWDSGFRTAKMEENCCRVH